MNASNPVVPNEFPASPRGRSVLLLEDDAGTRNALVTILKSRGFQIKSTKTVNEALEALDNQQYAILDLNLPDGVGTTLLARIRSLRGKTLVAVASGTTDAGLMSEARSLRPDRVFSKPVDLAALLDWMDRAD